MALGLGEISRSHANGHTKHYHNDWRRVDARGLPWNGVITDDMETFVDAAVSLYQDKESWLLMQQNGNRILQARYQAEEWEPILINRLKLQFQLKESLRKKHFLGLMLRHHSLKSTQYMSQWIELKNKNEKIRGLIPKDANQRQNDS